MKIWIKILFLCVAGSALLFGLVAVVIWKTSENLTHGATDPAVGATAIHSMFEIADPLPANFVSKGGTNTPLVDMAVVERNGYIICFTRPFRIHKRDLRQAIAENAGFSVVPFKDFKFEKIEAMSLANGTLEYAIGTVHKKGIKTRPGMIGVISSNDGNTSITLSSYDLKHKHDGAIAKEFLSHIKAIK